VEFLSTMLPPGDHNELSASSVLIGPMTSHEVQHVVDMKCRVNCTCYVVYSPFNYSKHIRVLCNI
jgi:hypothetical protein